MTRSQMTRPFPESYFQDVEQEIAKMDLRPFLRQAILDNIHQHLERLAAEKKDPVAVLGTPQQVPNRSGSNCRPGDDNGGCTCPPGFYFFGVGH